MGERKDRERMRQGVIQRWKTKPGNLAHQKNNILSATILWWTEHNNQCSIKDIRTENKQITGWVRFARLTLMDA